MIRTPDAVFRGSPRRAEAAAGPTWGICATLLAALAVAYPFHYYVEGPGGVTDVSLGDAVVAIVVIGFVISLLWDRIAFPRYVIPTAVFMLVALTSLLYPLLAGSEPAFFDPRSGVLEIVKVAGGAAWMLAVYILLRRAPLAGFRIFATVSVIAASAFALGTVVQSLVQADTRPSGPFENENLYANYLALNVFLSATLARLHELDGAGRGARAPLWLTTPILLVGILATGSRGALIGAAAAYPLLLNWRRPSGTSRRRLAATVLAVVLSGCGIVAFWHANPFIAWRISTVLSGQGPNIQDRANLWGMALEAFAGAPVLGIGYHQFPQYAEAIHGWRVTVPHNTYLSMAAELGGVGLIAFAGLFVPVIRDALRVGRGQAFIVGRPILAIVVATLIQGFFANVEHYRSLWIAMGLMAGMEGAFRDA
jgi:O-antigen ligase